MDLMVFWLIIVIISILLIWLASYASRYKVPIIRPSKVISYPQDHRIIVENTNDLLRLDELGITPYNGLIIFCLENNKVYLLKGLNYHESDSWQELN